MLAIRDAEVVSIGFCRQIVYAHVSCVLVPFSFCVLTSWFLCHVGLSMLACTYVL